MANILIVEDDIDTNEAVCEYLKEAGHNTISAFDGDEAITLFSENKVDLVVLDIMLPTNRFYYSYQANDLFLLFQRLLNQSSVLHLRNE